MESMVELQKQYKLLLAVGMLDKAEQLLDQMMDSDLDALAQAWDLPQLALLHMFSVSYNNLGMTHIAKAERRYQLTEDITVMQDAARRAERCHEKALDLYDISIEEISYLPPNHPLNKDFIFALWGLGITSYYLERHEESRKYLHQCLHIRPEDEQAATWQSDASNYLHRIELKPVQIMIQSETVIPNMFNRQLLSVRGTLREWNSYAPPMLEEYIVHISETDAQHLAGLGFVDLSKLSGHTLTLSTDESCDLYRPLQIVGVK